MTSEEYSPRVSRRAYFGLAAEMLHLAWKRMPARFALIVGLQAAQVGLTAAIALGMRAAVNDAIAGQARAAAVAGLVVALACASSMFCGAVVGGSTIYVVERVALLDLMPQVHRNVATLEGIEHLERTDFLDRLTIASYGSWNLMYGFLAAVRVCFTVLQLGVTLLLLGTLDPWLMSLLVFAGVPLWFERIGKRGVIKAETDTAEQFRLQRHLFEVATDPGSGKEIRVAGSGTEIARLQRAAWDKAAEGRFQAQVRAAIWKLAGWILFALGFVAALWLVVYRAAHGHGSIGDIVLSITVATTLRGALQGTVAESVGAAAAGRVVAPYLWLRSYVAEERARAQGTDSPPDVLSEGIVFDDVTYTYPGTDRTALDGVSLSIPPGSVVAIVGEYGSGKTTLVKLLNKFYCPDSGRILIDGVDLADLDTDAWRERSAAAFQDFGRFKTLFSRNVGFGDLPRLDDRTAVAAAVAEANAQELVERLPQGMDTELGVETGGVDLSEGQWQKAALARASMRTQPLLFVLDEPTASLDAPSEQEIFERYMRRARGLSRRTGAVTVIVSHRFSTVAGADLILVLADGKVVEAGRHEELVDRPGGRYADLYGLQAAAYSAS
ncbi:ABC transporter ATP-binding protein [Actinospica robiniae]|uniref:ABC transporter ATP-binding protein n=1 Tax=Actinospica robiniae TaxID=304901 RepID=UPI00040171C3|nr:ABC transporter ATP-binding protein [Actinospica robiniae]